VSNVGRMPFSKTASVSSGDAKPGPSDPLTRNLIVLSFPASQMCRGSVQRPAIIDFFGNIAVMLLKRDDPILRPSNLIPRMSAVCESPWPSYARLAREPDNISSYSIYIMSLRLGQSLSERKNSVRVFDVVITPPVPTASSLRWPRLAEARRILGLTREPTAEPTIGF
jgi:hypothetical protein